ncbi:MAG: hypothetical protein ILP11_00640 [Alphaproteobacteria bacterium]|nr:hypothetical protein [Alphaproteobacteria bacterium]
MKKWYLLALLAALPAQAQMTDVLGSMAVQGAMTRSSAQSVSSGTSKAAAISTLQTLQMIILDIRSQYWGQYKGLSENLSDSGLTGTARATDNGHAFEITLPNVSAQACQFILSGRLDGLKRGKLNGKSFSPQTPPTKDCKSQNKLQLILS